jgi:hypothetical protein
MEHQDSTLWVVDFLDVYSKMKLVQDLLGCFDRVLERAAPNYLSWVLIGYSKY